MGCEANSSQRWFQFGPSPKPRWPKLRRSWSGGRGEIGSSVWDTLWVDACQPSKWECLVGCWIYRSGIPSKRSLDWREKRWEVVIRTWAVRMWILEGCQLMAKTRSRVKPQEWVSEVWRKTGSWEGKPETWVVLEGPSLWTAVLPGTVTRVALGTRTVSWEPSDPQLQQGRVAGGILWRH